MRIANGSTCGPGSATIIIIIVVVVVVIVIIIVVVVIITIFIPQYYKIPAVENKS